MYMKLARSVRLENPIVISEQRSTTAASLPPPPPAAPVLSKEEAERVADDMINSFKANPMMKELLEGAKWFAGAEGLTAGGKRTRRKISLPTI